MSKQDIMAVLSTRMLNLHDSFEAALNHPTDDNVSKCRKDERELTNWVREAISQKLSASPQLRVVSGVRTK